MSLLCLVDRAVASSSPRHQLPTITVESPKAWQCSENSSFPTSHLHTLNIEPDDNTASSDSECPDIEGVKSLYLHSKDSNSPSNNFFEPSPSSFEDHDHYSEYYSDPWSMYSPDIEEEEHFAMEEPPFDPISEEVDEDECTDLRRSPSNATTATTTVTHFSTTNQSHSEVGMFTTTALVCDIQNGEVFRHHRFCRHLSLEFLGSQKYQKLNETARSLSYPLIFDVDSTESSSSPSPQELFDPVEDIWVHSAIHDESMPFQAESTMSLKENNSLMWPRVTVLDVFPVAVVGAPPDVHLHLDLQAYAKANWIPQNTVEGEPRIITISEEDQEDNSYSGLLAMRRCRNFANINQLSGTGENGSGGGIVGPDTLYTVAEEDFDKRPHAIDDASEDGQPLHRWGREQIYPAGELITPLLFLNK